MAKEELKENALFRFLGKRGYLGNLYPNVRGGIPRGVGIVPFAILALYFLPKFNNLVLIIGIFAFIDDIFGRRKFNFINIETLKSILDSGRHTVSCT